MSATTTTMASANKQSSVEKKREKIARERLALRGVRHTYAPKIAQQARIMAMAAKKIRKLESDMAMEAKLIAGAAYEENHTITFDGHGSIENQLEIFGEVQNGAGIEDIERKALEMAKEAEEVAEHQDPPPLPYEGE